MLPPKPSVSPAQRRLLSLFESLDETGRSSLLSFAEFLHQQPASQPAESQPPSEPLDIPRPEEESVVGAIRRLSRSYHMLDKQPMLDKTSSLMSAHLIQGRGAVEVIDELELLFESHYRQYLDERQG